MSREFKFRGWNTEDKVMVYNLNSLRIYNGKLIQDDYIVMQWTGLKDNGNIDVYEGDILINNFYKKISPVFFDQYDAGFDMFIEKFTETNVKECEVIGNIYENPELVGDE